MGSLRAIDVLDRLSSFGCQVRLEGDKLKVRGPDRPEVEGLVSELRREREAAIAFLRDRESKPPSLEEVKALLPVTNLFRRRVCGTNSAPVISEQSRSRE